MGKNQLPVIEEKAVNIDFFSRKKLIGQQSINYSDGSENYIIYSVT